MSILVLYVDDEAPLRDLADTFLSREPDLEVISASSATEGLAILKKTRVDIIVSDYQMPGMDGLAFLSEINARGLDIPVILFTGRGREEVAVEAFNRGAIFYVQKGVPVRVQFSELIHKIRIAVDRDRTKKALIESEQRYRSFFSHTLMGSAILDPAFVITEVNDHLCSILGYPREDLIAAPWARICPEEERPGENTTLPSAGQSEGICYRKDGTAIHTRTAISPVYEGGIVTGYSLLISDITQEVRAAEVRRMNELRLVVLHDLYMMKEASEDEINRFILRMSLQITRSPSGFLIAGEPGSLCRKVYTLGEDGAIGIRETGEDIVFGELEPYLPPGEHEITECPRHPVTLPGILPGIAVSRILCIPHTEETFPVLVSGSVNRRDPYTRTEIRQISLFLHDCSEFITRIRAERELNSRYTELVESWNLVAEHENSTRTLLNALGDSSLLVEPGGTILDYNRTAGEVFSIPGRENQPAISEVLPDIMDRGVREGIRSARESGTDQRVTAEWNNRTYEWSIHPIKGLKQNCGRMVLFCRDITSIREIEEELEQSRERYRQFTEFLPQSLFETNTEGEIVYLNPHACSAFQITPQDLKAGISYLRFIADPDREAVQRRFELRLRDEGEDMSEVGMVRSTGEVFPALIQAIPVRKKGEISGLRGIVIDLSPIREEEKARRELEEKYRTLIENAREIIIVSQEGNLRYINPLGRDLTGFTQEELIDKPFTRFIHPDDQELVFRNYLRRLESRGFRDDYIFRFLDREGGVHWVKTNAIRIEWEGKPATLNMLSEITDLIRAQEALAASESQLAAVFNFLPDPAFAIDRGGKVIFWNQELARLLRVPPERLEGIHKQEIATLLYGRDRPLLVDLLDDPEAPVPDNYQIQMSGKDLLIGDIFIPSLHGRPAYLWAKAVHLYNSGHEITGSVESIRDVTDRRRTEENLRTLNRKLNLFSSITRHDIRNQLSIILLAVDRLQHEHESGDVIRIAREIDRTVSRIDEFIGIAREFQEIGSSDPEWRPVMQMLKRVMNGTTIPLVVEETGSACPDLEIYTDPLLEKVFYNIIDNAKKYATGLSAITAGCARKEKGMVIFIGDDGPGVPADEKEEIFTKGYGEGTGLGLFLVREILSITGMEIAETGEPGKGARFEIFIPDERYRIRHQE